MKRALALLLAVLMLMSLFPTAAFAEDMPEEVPQLTDAVETPIVEPVIEPVVESAEAPVIEPAEAPVIEPEEELEILADVVEEPAAVYYSLTVVDSENGEVVSFASEYCEGDEVSLDVFPADGYAVSFVKVNGEEIFAGDNGAYVFIMPACDVEVTAGFAEAEKAPKAFAADDGAVEVSNDFGLVYAVYELSEGGTIRLTDNIVLSEDSVCFEANEANFTLDMNGYSLTGPEASDTICINGNNCSVSLIGGGSVSSNGDKYCVSTYGKSLITIGSDDSKVTFNGNLNLAGTESVVIYNGDFKNDIIFFDDPNKPDSVVIYGGIFENGITFSDDESDNTSCFKIYGGTFYGDEAFGEKLKACVPYGEGYDVATDEEAEPHIYKVFKESDPTDYLTFTAVEDGAVLSFNWKSAESVKYTTNSSNWSDYTAGTPITLRKAGDYVSFKGKNVKTDSKNRFNITGKKIAASGSVTSLTDESGADEAVELAAFCYFNMFNGCTSLTAAPALPATTLEMSCYAYMFNGCTSLTAAPALPATALATSCYSNMFNGCSSLTAAPALPATKLASSCYASMFKGCSSLTAAPALPATTLQSGCYQNMFNGCTSLTAAPALPATTLQSGCYQNMFNGCTSLTAAPALPATALAVTCYVSMFNGCTSLTSAPELKATPLQNNCYKNMFKGCTGLYVKKLDSAEGATWTIPAASDVTTPVSDMTTGTAAGSDAVAVPETGSNYYKVVGVYDLTSAYTGLPEETTGGVTFTVNTETATTAAEGVTVTAAATEVEGYTATLTAVDANGQTVSIAADGTFTMPAGAVTVTANYCVPDYLTFTSDSAFNVALAKSGDAPTVYVQYSTDKTTWNDWTDVTTAVPAVKNTDNKYVISFRNGKDGEYTTNPAFASSITKYRYFTFTVDSGDVPDIAASGNIMTLLDYKNPDTVTMGNNAFACLFKNCTSVTAAPTLPATKLAECCYYRMFYKCKSLTAAPTLPAETMVEACYQAMFQDCSSLTAAPTLPAETMVRTCYQAMFKGCSSLTAAPALPAKQLADSCYMDMFKGCSSLTAAPLLPATALADSCYPYMFQNCTGLYVTKLDSAEGATWTIPASGVSDPVLKMVTGTAAGGDAVAVPASGSNYYKVVPAYALKSAYSGLPEETTGGVTFTVNDTAGTPVAATTAAEGRTVTAIATEVEGYVVSLTSDDVALAADNTFTMPAGAVTVTATYRVDTTDYLTFTSDSAFNVALTKEGDAPTVYVQYSTDKTNWFDWDLTAVPAVKNTDNKYVISFRNGKDGDYTTNPAFASDTEKYHSFTFTDAYGGSVPKIAASGNIMTLLDYKNPDTFTMGNCAFAYLFSGCSSLTVAPALPATQLAKYCYMGMFFKCSSLIAAPELKAEAMEEGCYQQMFSYCTSLTAAPALPAMQLAKGCYDSMFEDCTSLTSAPELKATTLANSCYEYMFSGCTSLTAAPALNATSLEVGCYRMMFSGCTSLTSAPELNATTLADYCYRSMFKGCTSLTSAPVLSATVLRNNCYKQMFYGCTGLYVTKLDSAEGATWTIPAASGVTTPVSDMATGTAAGGDAVAVPASGSNYYKVVPAYALKSAYSGLLEETTGGVTFTVNDTAGAPVAATTAAEGRTVTAIATELVGYISTLTAVDANGQTVSIAADGTFTMPAGAVTVTAAYAYPVVTFDSNGGKSVDPQSVKKGETAVKPETDPTRDNSEFVEWQLDGKTYDFTTPVTENITLTAKWQLSASTDPVPVADKTTVQVVSTSNVKTSGLEKIAKAVKGDSESSVNVVLSAADKDYSESSQPQKKIKEQAGMDKKDGTQFFDLSLSKSVGGAESEAISETGENVLEVIIPYDMTKKVSFVVYRYHGTAVDAFTEAAPGSDNYGTDGTFYIEGTGKNAKLHFFTTKFSDYATGYNIDDSGVSISLWGDIAVNFYIDIDAYLNDLEGAYVELSCGDVSNHFDNLSDFLVEPDYPGAGMYKFYSTVNSAQMADELTVKLCDANDKVLYSKTTSIKAYCDGVINNTALDNAALKALCTALLDYGSSVQTLFAYNTANLANGGNYGGRLENAKTDNIKAFVYSDDTFVKSMSFLATSSSELRFYYNGETAVSDVSVKPSEETYMQPVNDVNDKQEKYFGLQNIPGAELGNEFTLTADGNTVKGSTLSYAKSVLGSSATEAQKNVAKAMINYGNAAKAYFGS